MEKRVSITAKISAFVRDFHSDKLLSRGELYNDPLAGKMLNGEIMKIWTSIAENSSWFCEGCGEGCEDPVLYGINRRLAPAVLAQAIWWEQEMLRELKMGTRQILLLGAGLDSLPYRQTEEMKKAKIYEVDMPEMIAYKERQLEKAKITMPENVYRVGADLAENWIEPLLWQTPFAPEERSLTVIPGAAYYLPQKALDKLLAQLANITPQGSTLLFDCQLTDLGKNSETYTRQQEPAAVAEKVMKDGMSMAELALMLERHGYLIYEDMDETQIEKRFYREYNERNPEYAIHPMPHTAMVLAVRH